MNVRHLTQVTALAQSVMSVTLNEGDTAVDATMGNGNDTLFLAKTVGKQGKVISFDIQEQAINSTRSLLEQNSVYEIVQLVKDGHENIDQYVTEEITGIMFNLGYLPKADHKITTRPETTILAINKSLSLLKRNGIMTIVIYYGHLGGGVEKEKVIDYVKTLNQNKFHVSKLEFINQSNDPPILVTIIKK
ncbi:class I SAM-dependent methyltransferase [Clostridiaceae bacterium 35-E11]